MPSHPPSAPLASALGAYVLAACSLPTANVQLSAERVESPADTPAPAPRPRKPGRDFSRPQIVDAELVTGDHLRLHFSEPLASLAGVDPNDFRLSMGMAKSYKFYAYAYYLDLGETIEGDHGLLKLARMSGQDDIVDLYLAPALDLAYCHEIATEIAEMQNEPGIRANGGLFLHYSPGESPIADAAGNGLAAIGPEWVLRGKRGGEDAYELYFEGPAARRAMHGLIPIECGPMPVESVTSP